MKGLIVDEQGCVRLVNDIPFPEPGDYEALVKVECCMICNGTDMEIIQKKLEETTRYPLVLGHEGVGVVVKTGKKVRNIKEIEYFVCLCRIQKNIIVAGEALQNMQS